MVVERLEKRLKDLDLELNPLLRLKDDLSHQLATAKSVKFIVKNGITKSQVQRCDDEGFPISVTFMVLVSGCAETQLRLGVVGMG